jgi:hypothetical protein
MGTKTPLDSCSSGAIDDTCAFNYETFFRRKKNSYWLKMGSKEDETMPYQSYIFKPEKIGLE